MQQQRQADIGDMLDAPTADHDLMEIAERVPSATGNTRPRLWAPVRLLDLARRFPGAEKPLRQALEVLL